MLQTATPQTEPRIEAALIDGMAQTVLLIEWAVKQQQLLKQQQRVIEEQRRQLEALQKENEELKDSVDKLKNRSSQNSSVPPSFDQVKKPSDKSKCKKGRKRGPKYNHLGKTRNGFGEPDQVEKLELDACPVCRADVELVAGAPKKVQQVWQSW